MTSHYPKVRPNNFLNHTSPSLRLHLIYYHSSTRRTGKEANSPRIATVQKIINEVLAANPGGNPGDGPAQTMTFAKDARDLLIECCVEFIQMLSSEANEIAEKEAKKTIACEHITKALKELGFPDYVDELERVAEEYKTSQAVSSRSTMPCDGGLDRGMIADDTFLCRPGRGSRTKSTRVA